MTASRHSAADGQVQLQLVREARFADLLTGRRDKRYEASGVHVVEDHLYVVFDDEPDIVRLPPDWDTGGDKASVIPTRVRVAGYEDITFQPAQQRWYCLIEASQTDQGDFKPGIDEFDRSFGFVASHWLDFPVKRENKGIEGLSTLRLRGEDYVLGLCEGNDCKSGSAGRESGKGRIQVFTPNEGEWRHAGTIALPRSVPFEDYAGLEVRDRTVTVISQVSSAVWVGRLKADPTDFADVFEDEGRTYLFPRDRTGRIIYCNLEGVTWLPDGRLVVVSDRANTDEQASRCRRKDQSIHIFAVPDPA